MVFCVALAVGSAWALLTPPFQVPDEPGHFAYTQYLAETGRLPEAGRPSYSAEQQATMRDLKTTSILGEPHVRVPTEGVTSGSKSDRADGGGPTGATSQPPLYYAVEAVPYWLTAWAPLTTRLFAMRLLSVVFFALTAGVAALFAAEVLPGRGWAPVVAGLSVALSPAVGAIAGGVTPDNLLALLSSLMFLYGVRALRTPSVRAATLVGGIVGVAAVTKITFWAMIPGAACLLAGISYRMWRITDRNEAMRALATAVGVAAVFPLCYAVWTILVGRGLVGASVSTPTLPSERIHVGHLREQLSYTWQLYLPRAPWMDPQFPGEFPLQTTWLNGYLGRYGWLDYASPTWLLAVGRDVSVALLTLLIVSLARRLAAIRRHLLEVGIVAVCVTGLLVVIATAGYEYRNNTSFTFEQVRYLFPLSVLFAGGFAVACEGVGRRWAPVVGALIVGLLCLHGLSGLVLTAVRYYA